MENRNGYHLPSKVVIPTIIVTDYDAELAVQQQIKQESNEPNVANSGSRPHTISCGSNESGEEEDREIIKSLTKAHSTNPERHVDDMTSSSRVIKIEQDRDEMTSSSRVIKVERSVDDLAQKVEQDLQKLNREFATDDDMADLEVSQLTSLHESKNKFAPVPDAILNLQRPTASFPAVPPPGTLPDISDVAAPPPVPIRKSLFSTDSFELEIPNFQPLGEMSYSVSGCRYDRDEDVPENISKNKRTVRLSGESGLHGSTSSDEQPPQYWKLYNNGGSDKSDSGSKEEDIDQILSSYHVVEDIEDVKVPSTSNNLTDAN